LGAAYLETGKSAEGRAKVQEALGLGLPKPDEHLARTVLARATTPR
jgi:hypothetical protein